MVRQRNFTRTRVGTAADHGGRAGAVVGAAERTVAVELLLMVGQERTQCPYFDQFVFGQRRKDAGQTLRKHGFARTRRAHHQQAVSACRCDFQSKASGMLAFDIG